MEKQPVTRRSLIIIDDFYPEPDEVRAIALPADFSIKGNYPGLRTRPYLTDYVMNAIQDKVREPIRAWDEDIANGSFQYTTCRDRTWIHADLHNNWAGVIYLTPDAPPSSGTAFYRHVQTGCSRYPEEGGLRDKCGHDSQDYTKWVKLDSVANVYNRLILFAARQFHASQDYFGDSLEDGRLFQTFFFNTNE
jgi:hypothetical protein